MLETIKGTLNAVSASITLSLDDGSEMKIDLPLKRGFPTVYEFDVDRPEEDISSWYTPLMVSSVWTRYEEMRLTLPMSVREDGTFFTITEKDSPKMLRETLCVAQSRIADSPLDEDRKWEHIERLQRLIDECDRQRRE